MIRGAKRGLTWDLAAAMRAITFFPVVLRLNGGQFEGRKFDLHPSQAFRIGSLFGWKQADGTRRFRRFYDEEGKGNGKSPLLAGIGLYCLLADGEARAEVYAAGSKKDQAMVLFRDAVAMVDQSPALAARLTKSGGNPVWNLADLKTGSFFRPISSDEGQSGPRPSCALCDEVHEHRDARTVELLERGFKWRRQPLLVMATNSGTDRNSICWQEHEHAVRVAAGTRTPDAGFTYVGEVIDDETFSFVCTLDSEDDPLNDPACWIKANPLLGVTVTEAYLAGVVRQAKAIPGKLNNILRLHFCQWTDAEESWMSRAALEAVLADFDPLDLSGEDAYAGLDLSGSQDLTALAVVVATGMVDVPRDDGSVARLPTFDAWIEAWTPRDTMAERALRDQQPYDVWAEQGHLQADAGAHQAELRLLTCSTMVERAVRRQLRQQFNVTLPRFDLMAQLERSPDGMTLGELSQRMMVSNGNVTGLVRLSGEHGLVVTFNDPADRRATYVRLTAAGRANFAEMAATHAGWIADMFTDLDAEAMARLMDGRAAETLRHPWGPKQCLIR